MRWGEYGRAGGWATLPLVLVLLSGCGTPASTAVASLVEPTAITPPAPTATATPRPTATATVPPTATSVPPTVTTANTPTPARAATSSPTPRPPVVPTTRATIAPTGTRAATPFGGYAANWATWESGDDPGGRFRRTYQRAQDEYRVQVLEADQEWSFFAPEGQTFQDFTLDVEANRLTGSDTIGYGLVFRRQARKEGAAASERYIFSITPQGRYSLFQVNANNTQRTLRPLDAPGIPSVIAVGDGTNRLRVTCQGAKITLAINGVDVYALTNATITQGGEIGVFVQTPTGQADATVAFRRLTLTPIR